MDVLQTICHCSLSERIPGKFKTDNLKKRFQKPLKVVLVTSMWKVLANQTTKMQILFRIFLREEIWAIFLIFMSKVIHYG